MKIINFINVVPPKLHKELRRWFIVSATSCSLMLVVIIFFQIKQLIIYYEVKTEKTQLLEHNASFDALTKNKQQLKQQEEEIKIKLAKINSYMDHATSSARYLSLLNTMGNIWIESLSADKKNIELTVLCPDAKNAQNLVTTLAQIPWLHALKIISLAEMRNKDKTMLQAVLKGTIESSTQEKI